jgi:pimeloyl-ACP methyl ester carboxylesterase
MKIYIDDGFLEYEMHGNGIPLLLIHGYPLSRMIWLPQMDELSDVASLISIDLRGHGNSFPFEGSYLMDLLASDCMKLLDDLNIKQPIVVCGLSLGGYVTMALYRINPDIFKGMILTSTRPGPDSPEGKANRDVSILNAREHGASIIADNMLPKLFSPVTLSTKPEIVKMTRGVMAKTSVQGILGALQGMKERPDSSTMLTQINCPVLIIHGTDDQLIPQKEAELMNHQIPTSHLVKITDSGHLPNLEQPEKYNQAVRDFLQILV